MKHFLLSVVLLACSAVGAEPAAQRPISAQDLFQFQWIGDPQMAPRGDALAYVGISVDEARSDYATSLYRVDTASKAVQRLSAGKRDSAPRWSPDGRYLAFLRAVEKDGKPQPAQLFMLAMNGGEAVQLSSVPGGVSSPVWSPDGNSIAFLSSANAQDLARAACAERHEKCPQSRDSDVKVITRSDYRDNNIGYRDFSRPRHLWSIAVKNGVAAGPARQLTAGDYDEGQPVWAPDSQALYFVSNRVHEAYYELARQSIYKVAANGGASAEVAAFAGSVSALSVSPQGRQLAFLGTLSAPVQSHTRTNLWVQELGGAAPARNLTAAYDWEIGGSIIGDQSAPRAAGSNAGPQWSPDGKSLLVLVAREGRANVERIELAGAKVTPLTTGRQAVAAFASNGKQLAALVSSATELNELYLVQPDGGQQRLTGLNAPLFSQLRLSAPEELWYPSFDGRKVHALVQLPPDFDPAKKYPLILNIHGGPHAAYGFTFFHEMQLMAARGYIVLYPNPRGSTTYGEQFANVIQYRYPGDDYLDLMAGVDQLVKRGIVDEKRMGVTGGSGGGLLTNWTVGHTDRFAAAVSQRDIADWTAWWYSSDITFFRPAWFRKPPFEDPEDYRQRSPITYINQVKTPTMFVLGDADTRTPAESGGEQMFRALKYRKVPTAMVRFPGETHDLSRSGKPWHRVERLQHILNWFDLYLMDKQANDYTVMPPAQPDLQAVPQ